MGLERHRLHRIELDGLVEALAQTPVRLSSMGRDLDQDPGYFLAAAAAGRLAARLLGIYCDPVKRMSTTKIKVSVFSTFGLSLPLG